jgi:tetratricopeptide (TPR) repeat protein
VTGVRLTAEGDSVVVRDGDVAWKPDSGQALLDFDVSEFAAKVEPLARKTARAAEQSRGELDADEWYLLGCDMEPFDREEAKRAYTSALELDPAHGDARLNLGRLLHEAGDVAAAEVHYRRVLDHRPEDPTAWYNLGVVLEDVRKPIEALDAYEKVLECDPTYADAHFNLSSLCEQLGDFQSALKHLQLFRRMQHR